MIFPVHKIILGYMNKGLTTDSTANGARISGGGKAVIVG